ncbi:hypothetical protein PS627_04246 [Pseudomonas fluorescens]|uniref:DUF3077 domain-containing protein n=1 Tax=Pseudomonas fluorescens TaxID=294 RepID=UPI00125AA04D|nr:DUF3077 domain-containing protein [Pseudomonas fluorescens]CAG8871031.1 hypothetical protein PS627_04246 [Pseudomonas fluorescens]VVP69152.1 hypothetical protein PS910_00524 [Pseudomonas fluorescens]
MSSNMKLKELKTTGIGTFGEGVGGKIADRLFKVQPGHDAEYALEQASVLLDCVYNMTLDAGVDGNGQMVWGAHYLSGMAKALVEDVAHGMMTGPVR